MLLRSLGGRSNPSSSQEARRAGRCGVSAVGSGTDQGQQPAELLSSDSHGHTRSLTMQWVHSELGEVSCLGLPTHPRSLSLVKEVTSTVISDSYPIINANNGSNIPFSDHLGSNKGCN